MKSEIKNRKSASGFTLVELLVVITIIVVLLALLTPALDKAIYQAELAVCAANHHATVNGALMYTVDYQRRYPYRPGHSAPDGSNQPDNIRNNDSRLPYDYRPMFRGYIPLKALVCPLTQKVDLSPEASDPSAWITATYYLWFGFQYNTNFNERGMLKLGDRFTFQGSSFNVLTSPRDVFWAAQNLVSNSHPDRDTGIMVNRAAQNEQDPLFGFNTGSAWSSDQTYKRGPVDANYGRDDGSVDRYNRVIYADIDTKLMDPRMVKVPGFASGGGWNEPVYAQLPPAK